MIALQVRFDRDDYLSVVRRFEQQFPAVLDNTVRGVASDAMEKVLNNTPVKTGQLKRNWQLSRKGNCNYEIKNDTSYVNHIEFGTRDHGPVTAPYLHFPIIQGNSIQGWVRTLKVRGIRARKMVANVIPWITEQLPLRVRAQVESLWARGA